MGKVNITRQQESELPAALDLQFINVDADHQQGTQQSRRTSTLSQQKVNVSCPIVMTDHEASDIAERLMYNVWIERDRLTVDLPRKFMFLEPTDVFTLHDEAGEFSYIVRIVKRTESRRGGYSFECVTDYSPVYQQNKATTIVVVVPQVPRVSSKSVALFMDLPVLRETDAGAGFYIPMAGETNIWSGGTVYRSTDSGANYSLYATGLNAATIGTAQNALAETGGTLTVLLDTGELATATPDAVAAGANLAAIQVLGGWEVIQFTSAVLQAPVGDETKDTYLLGGLVRGKFGTEWATAGHLSGNKFVLLDTASVQRVHITNAEINTDGKYKVLSSGATLGSVPAQSIINFGVALKPYSVTGLIGESGPSSGDVTFSWTRRLRVGESISDPQNYVVEIWNSTFTTLLRSLSGLSLPTAVYTASQISTDNFGTTPTDIYFKIFSVSPVVGKGYETRGGYEVATSIVTLGAGGGGGGTVVIPTDPTPDDYRILHPADGPTSDSQFGPWKVLGLKNYPTSASGAQLVDGQIVVVLGYYSYDGFSIDETQGIVERLDPATGLWTYSSSESLDAGLVLNYSVDNTTYQEGYLQVLGQGNVEFISGLIPEGHSASGLDLPEWGFFHDKWATNNQFGTLPGLDTVLPNNAVGNATSVGSIVYWPIGGYSMDFSAYTRVDFDPPPSKKIYYTDQVSGYIKPYIQYARPASVAVGDKIFTLGAGDITWIYDTVTETYTEGAPHPLAVQSAHASVIGTDIYVVGGDLIAEDATTAYRYPTARVFKYDTVTDSWQEMSPLPQITQYYRYPGVIMVSDQPTDGQKMKGRTDICVTEADSKLYITGAGLGERGSTSYQMYLPPNTLGLSPVDPGSPEVFVRDLYMTWRGLTFEYDPSLDTDPPQHVVVSPDYGAPKLWDGTQFIAASVTTDLLKQVEIPGALWTSTDGTSFTSLGSSDCPLRPDLLFHSSGVYLLHEQTVGHSETYRSTDLTHWTLVTSKPTIESELPEFDGGLNTDIIVEFIEYGSDILALYRHGDIAISSDLGITWARHTGVRAFSFSSETRCTGLVTDGDFFFVPGTVNDGSTARLYYGPDPVVSGSYFGNVGDDTGFSHELAPDVTAYNARLEGATHFDGHTYVFGNYYQGVRGPGVTSRVPLILRHTDGDTGTDWTNVSPAPTLATSEAASNIYNTVSGLYKMFRLSSTEYIALGDRVDAVSLDGGATWVEYARGEGVVPTGAASDGTILATQMLTTTYDSGTKTYTHEYTSAVVDIGDYS